MIATLGYYGGTSPGTVQVNVDNATLVRHYGQTGDGRSASQSIFS